MLFKHNVKNMTDDELHAELEHLRQTVYMKIGDVTPRMTRIAKELARRYFKEHPYKSDPNYKWTDYNRWDKD